MKISLKHLSFVVNIEEQMIMTKFWPGSSWTGYSFCLTSWGCQWPRVLSLWVVPGVPRRLFRLVAGISAGIKNINTWSQKLRKNDSQNLSFRDLFFEKNMSLKCVKRRNTNVGFWRLKHFRNIFSRRQRYPSRPFSFIFVFRRRPRRRRLPRKSDAFDDSRHDPSRIVRVARWRRGEANYSTLAWAWWSI